MYLIKKVLHSTAQILIVDDHEMIREGIRALLSSRPQWRICGEAVDGLDALEKVKNLHPDIVLMDVSMPRMDGLTALRILRRKSPEVRVIMVTQNDAIEPRRKGMVSDGFVLKASMYRDLIPTIDRVLRDHPLAADGADVQSLRGSHDD